MVVESKPIKGSAWFRALLESPIQRHTSSQKCRDRAVVCPLTGKVDAAG